jgi:hypothetical protein
MAKKGRVKSQHFVPRCLLRRFSQSDKTTSVFVLGTATFVETAGIKTQCAADYYYGYDQSVETTLGELETAFSAAVGNLSVDTISSMTESHLAAVRAFVHVQAERTPLASEVQRRAMADLGRQLYAAYAKANHLPEDAAHEEGERFADDKMPVPGAHTVGLAIDHRAAIDDLAVKFIEAPGLMISDHPALTLNIWRDEHPRFSTWRHLGGLVTKGFTYMMPVATNRLAVIYDADTYQVGPDGERLVSATPTDVIAINALQTINATRLLFDSTVVMPMDLIAALSIRNQVRAEHGPGPLPLRPTGIPLSFLRVTDHDLYEGWEMLTMPCRAGAKTSSAIREGTKQ